MPYRLAPFVHAGLSEPLLESLLAEHEKRTLPRLTWLWEYYRNPIRPDAAADGPRPYRMAQERGLPTRLRERGATGALGGWTDDRDRARREVVIENDIAWRIHVMVDHLMPGPVRIRSLAREESSRRRIDAALVRIWSGDENGDAGESGGGSGGAGMLRDAALMAHVYGHVDLLVRWVHHGRAAGVRIEAVEPTRAVPLAAQDDYRRLDAYIIRTTRASRRPAAAAPPPWAPGRGLAAARAVETVTEVLGPSHRQVYLSESVGGSRGEARLIDEGPNEVSPGRVPIVHVQNLPQPLVYEGLGEVEPLIPLQDELNTRLSDRAFRVTMQSFKMYLGRGIDGFDRAPIAPGVMWSTDNPDASISEFGGDADSPSETAHIDEVRLAMDKVSGVPPLAAGVVGKIGNLTSENALRVTLQGLLTRTARKRQAWAEAIARASRLALGALDLHGALPTDEADRSVRVEWPDALLIGNDRTAA